MSKRSVPSIPGRMGTHCTSTQGILKSRPAEDASESRNPSWPLNHCPMYVTSVLASLPAFFYLVKSFIEFVQSLFDIPGIKAILSERISQDPLEKFFSCQQQRGGRHKNPNVHEFLKNTQALAVIDSLCSTREGKLPWEH